MDEEDKLRRYRPELERLRLQQSDRQGELRSQQASLKQLEYEAFRHLSEEQINRKIVETRDEYRELVTLYESLSTRVKEKQKRLNEQKGGIEVEERHYKEKVNELAGINRKLEARVRESHFDALERVKEVLQLALNIDTEKAAISNFRQELGTAESAQGQLQQQVKGKTFDPDRYHALLEELEELESRLANLTRQIGGLEEMKKQQLAQWAHKQELAEKLEKQKLRAENLRTLINLFKGNGFVNYISTVYLENLCAAANERFMKLTRNAMSLEVDDSNQFHVRDLLNDGRRRSVRTLSGGQTFQASLCLALALADQVQQQAQARQNFFFLDEGFGSQDKASLQLIFQTLKSLRQERRIVGVISHVEELQQEIDTHLQVSIDPERGSIVRYSWE
jgi:exonuclease SbcC